MARIRTLEPQLEQVGVSQGIASTVLEVPHRLQVKWSLIKVVIDQVTQPISLRCKAWK
jgi:hypothetical protein